MDLTNIIAFDKLLLSSFNGSDSLFLNHFFLDFTSGFTWIPLYVALFYLVMKNNEKWSRIFLIMFTIGVCMLLSYSLNNAFTKPYIGRLRPSLDPSMVGIVRLVNGYTAEGFSFFSAHACNTFAVATFFTLLVRSKILSAFLFLWAAFSVWTRLFLGVHYFSDIVVGTVVGMLLASLCYLAYSRVSKRVAPISPYVSSQYTATGYSLIDIDVVISTMVLLCLYCVLRAFIEAGIY